LLNFFHSSAIPTAVPPPQAERAANYYRLLDFIEVPSRFAGAEKWYNPQDFGAATEATMLRPPFNRMSRFRDPGRVNLNTIWDERVWQGVSDGYTPLRSSWTGGSGVFTSMTASPTTMPTEYPFPFKPAGAAYLTPPVPGLQKKGVDATLLRPDPATATQPLLDAPGGEYSPMNPEKVPVSPLANPYFRYQGLQRLGNLVTTQSNVFAVWVTVGYFEVTPSPAGQDPEHPDGFLLGPEVGLETGEIVRHRGFYLIDRTIPVAFQPGVNHNVENTILLRRFIE
jgi:hypothetical protein